MEVQEFLPKRDLIKDLYQLEDFKPLDQFLREVKDGCLVELLKLKFIKEEDKIQAVALNAQINLLGTIIELPKILSSLAEQFEEKKKMLEKQRQIASDPLAEEI